MSDKKSFSERLYETVRELLASRGTKEATQALGLQENYFAPSKYSYDRFKGKAIGHLDQLEEYFEVDLLAGVQSALAREIEEAEWNGVLSPLDRRTIRNIIESARHHAGARGADAVERVKKQRRPKRK